MGFELHVNYVYAPGGATTPPPPTSGAQVLTNWAGQHPAFGRPVSAFTPYTSWLPGWTTNYMYFAYSGGRTTLVWMATSQNDPRVNYVIFWDPDAEKWSGWIRV